jgi:hypothetical protein
MGNLFSKDPFPHIPGSYGYPVLGEALSFGPDQTQFVCDRIAKHGPVFKTSLLSYKIVILGCPADASKEKVEALMTLFRDKSRMVASWDSFFFLTGLLSLSPKTQTHSVLWSEDGRDGVASNHSGKRAVFVKAQSLFCNDASPFWTRAAPSLDEAFARLAQQASPPALSPAVLNFMKPLIWEAVYATDMKEKIIPLIEEWNKCAQNAPLEFYGYGPWDSTVAASRALGKYTVAEIARRHESGQLGDDYLGCYLARIVMQTFSSPTIHLPSCSQIPSMPDPDYLPPFLPPSLPQSLPFCRRKHARKPLTTRRLWQRRPRTLVLSQSSF